MKHIIAKVALASALGLSLIGAVSASATQGQSCAKCCADCAKCCADGQCAKCGDK